MWEESWGHCGSPGGTWSWGCGRAGFNPTQVVWIRLTGVICFLAGSFTALTDAQTEMWLFKAEFLSGEARSCRGLPARSFCAGAGAAVVQRGERWRSTATGKGRWLWPLVPLLAPSSGPASGGSSVCCWVLCTVT